MSNLTTIPEYRALEVFDQVPAGCTGVLVTNDRFAPHLRVGEFAVVDAADKAWQKGELFVISLERTSGQPLRIVQMTKTRICSDGHEGVMVAFEISTPDSLKFVDGPYVQEYWAKVCLGRVVGVIEFLRTGDFRA